MARRDLLPLVLAGGLVTFVAVQATSGGASREVAASSSPAPPAVSSPSSPDDSIRPRADLSPAAREARRRALDAAAATTYLARIRSEGQPIVTRWPTGAPVRVWVAPTSSLRGWHPRMVAAAREAFDDWRGVVPVDFRFVADSQEAQVIVGWRDRFDGDGRSGGLVGHARRHFDAGGWIVRAEVALAVHAVDGTPLEPALIRAAALHEVGHVLGLPHSDADDDIMAPSHAGAITRLSPRDVRTAQALYAMEAGPIH